MLTRLSLIHFKMSLFPDLVLTQEEAGNVPPPPGSSSHLLPLLWLVPLSTGAGVGMDINH